MESLLEHIQFCSSMDFLPQLDISRPTICPDELWYSYYWWLCRINGFRPARYSKRLNKYVEAASKTLSLYEALSWAADLSTEEFCSRHTMCPLYRVANKKDTTSFLSEQRCRILKIGDAWHQTLCCQSCMESDYKSLGRRAWRRSHQIPGCFWCQLHPNCPLKLVSDAWSDTPILVENPASPPQHILEHWKSLQSIQRFFSMCRILLNRTKPIPWRIFNHAIFLRAKEIGFAIYPNGRNRRRLSAHIRKTFPKEWLALIPLSYRSKKDISTYADSVIFSPQFCDELMAYPLVIATLWENSSEAIKTMEFCDGAGSFLDLEDPENLEDLKDLFDEP